MTGIYWPGTSIVKSQNNAFTAHLRTTDGKPPVYTKVCRACGLEKSANVFSRGDTRCNPCRVPRKNVLAERRHMGAYSRA